MRHDPSLGKTSKLAYVVSGPHSNLPAHVPVEEMTNPLGIWSFCENGLSRCSLRAMRWNPAVSIALIIALLSTTARKHACSPFGPWREGTVRKGLLVYAMIGLPRSSNRYISVT